MSLLQRDSPEVDDAALGQDYTKGSSHVVWATIIAAALMIIVVTIYVIAGQKPPVVTGELEQVWVHPLHTVTSGLDANGAPMPKETYDQIYLFALVKLKNVSKEPLFLRNIIANAELADGIHSSYAATASDYNRVYVAYPDMSVPHGTPLSPQTTIAPGQTVEGNIGSAFKITKQDCDARKQLTFTFDFQYQTPLVLTPRTPPIDQ